MPSDIDAVTTGNIGHVFWKGHYLTTIILVGQVDELDISAEIERKMKKLCPSLLHQTVTSWRALPKKSRQV